MKRKDMIELRRAARLYLRDVEAAYKLSDAQWASMHRLSNALDAVVRETDQTPIGEMCKALILTLSDAHSRAYSGNDAGRDRMRVLCEFLGVR